jgi:AcrR family transcriptional regulator
MKRQYDTSRRKKAAERTRNEILQAALKLHWQGITEFGPLAQEAGCSVATLRKHFPNKEALFQNCTRTFAETLVMPDLQALGQITGSSGCIRENVSELCRIHEAMFGYAWLSAQQRKDSPTLDGEMKGYEGLTDAIAANVTSTDSSKTPLVRGLLDFLTYRALRLSAKLSPEQAVSELTATIHLLVLGVNRAPE